ncbi:hypothetical protein D3C81_549130 [compost metagenome]
MLAGLKELKNRITGTRQPWIPTEGEDYWKIEYGTERLLHNPQPRSPLTYEQEARIKTVKYH